MTTTLTKANWIPKGERVPNDRRKVHVWGTVVVCGCIVNRQGSYLGESRFNMDASGGRFDVEGSYLGVGRVVTHWTEPFAGPREKGQE